MFVGFATFTQVLSLWPIEETKLLGADLESKKGENRHVLHASMLVSDLYINESLTR